MPPERGSARARVSVRGPARDAVAAIVVLAALLSVPAAWAKSRWYHVEVIVFRYTTPSGVEQPAVLRNPPDYRAALSLVSDLPDFSDEPPEGRPNEVVIPGPVAFQSLPRGELLLGGVFQRLRTLPEYHPVLHVGWRQPGLDAGRARNVYLSDRPRAIGDARVPATAIGEGLPPAQWFEGTLQVRTGRLLHVDADFVNYADGEAARIDERRKLKLKELHYFDNPRFGVLVQVMPYHVDRPGEEDAPDGAGDDED